MSDPIAIDLAWSDGFVLDAGGDLALSEGFPAIQERIPLALLTSRGSVPYFPDDGGDAEQAEGGPPVDGGDLVRRTVIECRRDPDVLAATASCSIDPATGIARVEARVTTRANPASPLGVSFAVPTR